MRLLNRDKPEVSLAVATPRTCWHAPLDAVKGLVCMMPQLTDQKKKVYLRFVPIAAHLKQGIYTGSLVVLDD